jgi:hypothetical protein
MIDITSLTEGFAALKSGTEGIRRLLSLWNDIKGHGGEAQQVAATRALETSERQLQFAETQIAKGLGYTLCMCAFPPTPMLTVGWVERGGSRAVHRCPRCGITDNGGTGWTPTDSIRIRHERAGRASPDRNDASNG